MQTFMFESCLTTIDCGRCGGTYAINEQFRLQKQEQGGSWHCPYCDCSWGYTENELQRLRKQVAQQTARLDQAKARAADLEKSVIAQRAQTTKARNELARHQKRAAVGVCPCCHRTFKQLAAHMRCKHPNFVAEHATPAGANG